MSDEFRTVPFEAMRTEDDGDGLTLEGYLAVFDTPTEINGREGHFIERIKPGAFAKSLRERTPVLMFDHGKHPLIGEMPIGKILEAHEDARGVFVRARLADNWLIQPVRDAISSGAIEGGSFRFSVPKGKDTWRMGDKLRERDVHEVKCLEMGPVVFPAYSETTVAVRSQLESVMESGELARALFALSDESLEYKPPRSEERADTQPYGDVEYADPGYQDDKKKRYPIDSEAHVRAAWSYINKPDNQTPYTSEQVMQIKHRIMAAGKKYGINFEEENSMNITEFDQAATDDGAAEGTPDAAGTNDTEPLEQHSVHQPTAEQRRQALLIRARAKGIKFNG